jgi:hypothetical protein
MIRAGTFRKWVFPLLILVAAAGLAYAVMLRRQKFKKDHVLLELKAIQTPKGWGYDILTNGTVFIHQNMIPAIPGDHGFLSKEDALKVGQKVYDRVVAGQVPMVSSREVYDMGISIPDTTHVK